MNGEASSTKLPTSPTGAPLTTGVAPVTSEPAAFIARWHPSQSAERANYQLFLSELCDVIGVPRPDPSRPDDRDNAYVFERTVTFDHGDGTHSTGRIDLYKRGCFVLEAKQGSAATDAPLPLFEAGPTTSSTSSASSARSCG